MLRKVPPEIWLVLTLVACYPASGKINYVRPYFAAALIGSTLYQPEHWGTSRLQARWLVYLAAISYAVYILHVGFTHGWFDPASKIVRYERRPSGIGLTWLLAHLSMRYYEKYWIGLGKQISKRIEH